jgi:parallel beta-helix repeat protein
MKKLLFVTGLVFCFILTYSLAMANFYVIAGSKGVGTKITSLPYAINSPGFYFIAKDLSCVAGSHGISINVDNVTLDLMGFSLIGPGGTNTSLHGIYMYKRVNVEIRNGTIRNFAGDGIYENSNMTRVGPGHRVINIRVKDNTGYGIRLNGVGHLVEKCTTANNTLTGISVGRGSIVTDSICYNNESGIVVDQTSIVTDNICYNNEFTGIMCDTDSTVTGNTCYSNYSGIIANEGSTVTGNTCSDNTLTGIHLTVGCTVIGNTCRSNGNGITILNGNCFVDQNTAYGNSNNNIQDCASCTFGKNHSSSAPDP